MELFDKIGDTIVSVSKDATQKAKDISELARIRMELRAKQDYLNKLFLEIRTMKKKNLKSRCC